MSDAGVVVTLVAAIKKHFQDKPVVATACGLLRHLAKSDDIKKLLMGQDSLPVLTSVLDEHKGKAEVCAQVQLQGFSLSSDRVPRSPPNPALDTSRHGIQFGIAVLCLLKAYLVSNTTAVSLQCSLCCARAEILGQSLRKGEG